MKEGESHLQECPGLAKAIRSSQLTGFLLCSRKIFVTSLTSVEGILFSRGIWQTARFDSLF